MRSVRQRFTHSPVSHTMRAESIGHLIRCITDIYLHIVARMADYIRTHPYRYHFDQNVAAWLGFYSIGAGAAGGVVVGMFADRYQRRAKVLIVSLFCIATGGFLVFCLMCTAHNSRASLTHCPQSCLLSIARSLSDSTKSGVVSTSLQVGVRTCTEDLSQH